MFWCPSYSTFRDWAAERTAFPREVAEAALAHSVGDKVEAAYRRGDLFEIREIKADIIGVGMPADTAAAIAKGQADIATASTTPLASQTSNSIANSSRTSNRETNIKVERIEVQTQATDAQGIGRDIGGGMNVQMRQALAGFDDGVVA